MIGVCNDNACVYNSSSELVGDADSAEDSSSESESKGFALPLFCWGSLSLSFKVRLGNSERATTPEG